MDKVIFYSLYLIMINYFFFYKAKVFYMLKCFRWSCMAWNINTTNRPAKWRVFFSIEHREIFNENRRVHL